ncbi:lipoprotein insertase outer membrane protein LolB [Aliiglaciecola sp. LCG003]|uniref:lipoprotein insertase outer membrane protein LolB n=1 Tax=Aliiglaciecola sp. LCG003 TaxID=3053655 RepID=UPI00257250A0|nr:lipoprotein insertase outer membrane protein LolB [Aliiglaciecola sp. LCG003]WJG11314.1 lipoprotein insertase outer membrane protein LolB [Aliiglaciecola sp. LCG003]
MRIVGLAIGIICVLLLNGCASKRIQNQSVDSVAHQQALSEFNHWKIKGRMAFKSADEKFSAYVRWEQLDQQYDLQLNTFIGTTLMSMEGYPGYAKLEADDKTYTDVNASDLIQRITGWNIPVAKLSMWVKGQHSDQESIIYDDLGLVNQLVSKCKRCSPWILTYSKYKLVDELLLPHQIELVNRKDKQNQIKIKITSWQKL